MDRHALSILDRLQKLLKLLCWKNTELRLRVILLEAELRTAKQDAEAWKQFAISWEHETINWQQVALAAVAKSEKAERALWVLTHKTKQ